MPFKPGKSVSDASKKLSETISQSAIDQIKSQLGNFLNDEELGQVEIEYTNDDRVLVNGPDHIMDKIKGHQSTK